MNNITPPATAPKFVKCGNVTVPIYRSKCGGKPLYQVPYYPSDIGRRRLRSFRKPQDAQVFAKALAAGKAGDRHIVLRADPKLIRAATVLTAKFLPILDSYGITLDKAISEYREAKELLQGDDLVKFLREGLDQPWRKLQHTPFLTAMETFLAEKMASGRKQSTRDRHKYILKNVGTNLSNPPLLAVTKDQLKQQVHQSNRSPETNRSYRSTLGTFYQWLDENDYLRPDRSSPMAAVQSPITTKPNPAIITVPQARQALEVLATHATPEETLVFVLNLFAGFRKSELVQLKMDRIDLQAELITVPKHISKTGNQRRMPLLPLVAAWFGPFCERSGYVALRTDPHDCISEVLKAHGITWQRNWLRHSYSSYRMMATGDVTGTAEESGHSVAVMFHNYYKRVSKPEAEAYFALTPEACGITDWPQRVAAFLKETPEVLVRLTRNRKPKPDPEDDDETGVDE